MPIAKLLSVFVHVGEKERSSLGIGKKKHCPKCGTLSLPMRTKSRKAISFFGIPLITWNYKIKETCTQCHGIIQQKKANIVEKALWIFS